jgi:hypothetical protein
MQYEYLLHKYLGDVYYIASRFDKDEMNRLGQFIHHYHNGIILFGQGQQSSNEIHGDGFPFPLWDW